MCLFCLHICIHVYRVHTLCLWRSEVSVRYPGTGVTHECKPPCRCCQTSPDPLHEQQVLWVNCPPLSIFSKNKKAFFIKIEKVYRNFSVKTGSFLDLSLRIDFFIIFFYFQLQFPNVFFLRWHGCPCEYPSSDLYLGTLLGRRSTDPDPWSRT